MIYCRLVTHTIKSGDTLYLLARQYHTTVPAITLMNPGINPYNLQIGSTLKICMGETESQPTRPQMSERQLWMDMREALATNCNLSKLYMDSVMFDMPTRDAVMSRLMQNPEEITDIFTMFYSDDDADEIKRLWQNKIMQMSTMADAIRQSEQQQAADAASNMQMTASQLAEVLSNGNPAYSRQELERMMMNQANADREQMNLMMDGRYPQALMVYEDTTGRTMDMADYLTNGLIQNFYQTGE
ncbi:MAG: LysM peptidoglycan-binding domain-containing protein [Lachnospiraceae bacterium]|nr:LysM peptidoglycan-binding domain-containing protein [Lachnospiraceae bacterium]